MATTSCMDLAYTQVQPRQPWRIQGQRPSMEEEKEEEAGTSFWKARTFRPARNFRPPDLPACPEPPAPGVQTIPEHANSLVSPEPGRNLPGTSGARNFRPRPELPACLCAENGPRAHVSPSHLPLRGLALYILLHLLLVRFSVDLAQVRDRASLIHRISSS